MGCNKTLTTADTNPNYLVPSVAWTKPSVTTLVGGQTYPLSLNVVGTAYDKSNAFCVTLLDNVKKGILKVDDREINKNDTFWVLSGVSRQLNFTPVTGTGYDSTNIIFSVGGYTGTCVLAFSSVLPSVTKFDTTGLPNDTLTTGTSYPIIFNVKNDPTRDLATYGVYAKYTSTGKMALMNGNNVYTSGTDSTTDSIPFAINQDFTINAIPLEVDNDIQTLTVNFYEDKFNSLIGTKTLTWSSAMDLSALGALNLNDATFNLGFNNIKYVDTLKAYYQKYAYSQDSSNVSFYLDTAKGHPFVFNSPVDVTKVLGSFSVTIAEERFSVYSYPATGTNTNSFTPPSSPLTLSKIQDIGTTFSYNMTADAGVNYSYWLGVSVYKVSVTNGTTGSVNEYRIVGYTYK